MTHALTSSLGRAASRSPCRPRAICDGCAYFRPAFPPCVTTFALCVTVTIPPTSRPSPLSFSSSPSRLPSLFAAPGPRDRGGGGGGGGGGRGDREGRDQPTRSHLARPAQEPSCGERFAHRCLRECLRGCAYGRWPRSPQHGAAGRRCGVVPTRRAGAPPAGPPIPTHPTAGLRTSRALASARSPHQPVTATEWRT